MNNDDAAHDEIKSGAFETMGLGAGTRIQLIPGGRTGKTHYYTTVIGYVADKYLIVQTPLEGGLPVALLEGETLTIQVFSGLEVHSFDTTLLNVFRSPFFYLHLDYPSVVRSSSLRKSMRVKVAVPVAVKPARQGDAIQGVITNLSATGARIDSSGSFGEEGDSVALDFSFRVQPGDVEVRVDTKATIRSVKRIASADAGWLVGVEFAHLAADQRVLVQHLIYETLLADRKSMV